MNEVESYGEKNVELLLLGNKSDDSEKRVVSFEKAKVFDIFIKNRVSIKKKELCYQKKYGIL